MRLKNLLIWFVFTIAISGIIAIPLGFLLEMLSGEMLFFDSPKMSAFTQMLLAGLTLGSVAILGFFAYLVFNWLALGLLRNTQLFQIIQLGVIILIGFPLVQFQFASFAHETILIRLAIPIVVFVSAFVVSWWKVQKTKHQAFVPTFFFMVTATVLEAFPALNSKEGTLPFAYVLFTVLILIVCNAYQISNLHRWTSPKKQEDSSKQNKKANPSKKASSSKVAKA
ncbi:KinB-signaling pathway activation protein [Risungbinella massiliensis]|uniref:KinB-signaling pathway activation protein n=1 Tax=Risungbinella massiliensis TaxID=1329796 RepID=UPI00069B4C59|nr:KinB-signaling pathway activation protein [Risungbinella massiliensis]